ncbi:hypothetical protein KA013_00825 [Patescibacteria group bacterium]|nr:hypothetical protein [Patescibacteria group bacterium]
MVIDFPRHLVSILEQELYHATTPNNTERESEKVSINIAGQFYMASRVYDASLAANPSHAGRFNERLDNSNNPGYRDMYEKYAAIFKSFAPKFVPNPNGDLISDLKRAISENP